MRLDRQRDENFVHHVIHQVAAEIVRAAQVRKAVQSRSHPVVHVTLEVVPQLRAGAQLVHKAFGPATAAHNDHVPQVPPAQTGPAKQTSGELAGQHGSHEGQRPEREQVRPTDLAQPGKRPKGRGPDDAQNRGFQKLPGLAPLLFQTT